MKRMFQKSLIALTLLISFPIIAGRFSEQWGDQSPSNSSSSRFGRFSSSPSAQSQQTYLHLNVTMQPPLSRFSSSNPSYFSRGQAVPPYHLQLNVTMQPLTSSVASSNPLGYRGINQLDRQHTQNALLAQQGLSTLRDKINREWDDLQQKLGSEATIKGQTQSSVEFSFSPLPSFSQRSWGPSYDVNDHLAQMEAQKAVTQQLDEAIARATTQQLSPEMEEQAASSSSLIER